MSPWAIVKGGHALPVPRRSLHMAQARKVKALGALKALKNALTSDQNCRQTIEFGTRLRSEPARSKSVLTVASLHAAHR